MRTHLLLSLAPSTRRAAAAFLLGALPFALLSAACGGDATSATDPESPNPNVAGAADASVSADGSAPVTNPPGPKADAGADAAPPREAGPGADSGPRPATPFRALGTITTVFDPAFLSLEPFPAGQTSLTISTFSASPIGGTAGVSFISDLKSKMGALATVKDTKLIEGIKWPNGAIAPPNGIFGRPGLIVPGGFLVPGNDTGAITFVDNDGKGTALTANKAGYFYHDVTWIDMNGDGRLDMLAARANKPFTGAGSGELLWLEQPAATPLAGVWAEHVLMTGATAPDVNFHVTDLDGDNSPEIIATQFFSKRLVAYWFDGAKTAANLKSKLIDDQLGSAFDLDVVDLNMDGKLDVLVTNHEVAADEAKAAVFAYEIPAAFKTAAWPKHTLATGFKAIAPNPFVTNAAAPGAPRAFRAKTSDTTSKPLIVVSGDDYQKITLLTPSSSAATDWTYSRATIADTTATCGTMAVGDVDGDGWVEIFTPAYGKKTIHVTTFAP